jgi:hypothetical protein
MAGLLTLIILLSSLTFTSAVSSNDDNNQVSAKTPHLTIEKHKITPQEIEQLTSPQKLEANQTSNKLVDGHGTGLSASTYEELLEIAEDAYVIDSISYQSTPAAVDNSATPWFPPIGDQDGEGACAAWAVGYYIKTYQEAKEHGWDLSGARWEGGTYGAPTVSYQNKIMSPDFLYHLVNGGIDSGTTFEDVVKAACFIGISSWQKMPYNPVDHSSWPSEPAWIEAMLYRADSEASYQYLYANTDAGLTDLKNWLAAGNLAAIAVDADQYSKLSNTDVWTINNYVTEDLNHANTVVGYDDNIAYTENGVLTHGAFKIANSWGIGGWEKINDGFYWISYAAMKQLSTPLERNPCVIFEDLINYQPEIAASFQLDHNRRGECTITLGYGKTYNVLASKVFSDYVLGGNKPFCQNNIVVDITEFKQYMTSYYNQPFFMRVYDGKTYTLGTINYFAVGDSAALGTPLATRHYQTVSLTLNHSIIQPTLNVSPQFGKVGETLTLQGVNFPSNSTINLSYLNPVTNETVPIVYNISTLMGNFSYQTVAPDLNQANPAGDHPETYSTIAFLAVDSVTGNTLDSATFGEWKRGLISIGNAVAEGLFGNNTDLSTQVFVQVNQQFNVIGKYFGPGEITAICDGTFNVGTAIVNADGSFNATLTMPAQVNAGVHTVILTGAGGNFAFKLTRLPQVTSDYDGSWRSADFTVNLSSDGEGITQIHYRLNGGFETQTITVSGQPKVTVEGSNLLEYWGVWSNGATNIELEHTSINVRIDKSPPNGFLEINDGAVYTPSRSVTLKVTASDSLSGIWKARFSENGVWNTEGWEPYVNLKTWTLSVGDGTKTVYCQIMNNAGLITSFYDTIILDTAKPTVKAADEELVVDVGSTVTFDASDYSNDDGLLSYRWSFGDGEEDEGQRVNHVYSESGNYTAILEVKDLAGNNAQTKITVIAQGLNSDVIPEYPVSAVAAFMLAVISAALILLSKKKKTDL